MKTTKNFSVSKTKLTLSPFNNKKGAVLVLALVITSSLLILSSGVLQMATGEGTSNNQSTNLASAINVAEAGVESAIWELNYNTGTPWAGWSGTDPKTKTEVPLYSTSGEKIGEYDVSIADPTGDDPIIQVTSYVPDNTSPLVKKRTVRVTLASNESPDFNKAAASKDHLEIQHDVCIDSYDSELGEWNEVLEAGPPAVRNVGTEGDVGTNSTTVGDINIAEDVTIAGTAWSGQGSNPNAVIELMSPGTTTITGGVDDSPQNESFDPILPPTGLPVMADISGNASTPQTISSSGEYETIYIGTNGVLNFSTDATIYVKDQLMIREGAQIKVLNGAKVTIYIDNDLYFGTDSLVNANTGAKNPGNLTIKATDNYVGMATQGILLRDSTQFYGTIESNYAEIIMGTGSDIFGAIKAQDIIIRSTSCIHYDEALNPETPTGTAKFSVASWQEK